MSIREADILDVPHIVELGAKFHAMSPWSSQVYDVDVATHTVLQLIKSPDGVVFYNGSGILGASISPIFFGGGNVAHEHFWFAESGGRDLIKAYEKWAAEKNAVGILLMNLTLDPRTDKIMDRMYSRMGYTMREKNYYKALD